MGASSVHEAYGVYVNDLRCLYTYTCGYVRTYIARDMCLSNYISIGETEMQPHGSMPQGKEGAEMRGEFYRSSRLLITRTRPEDRVTYKEVQVSARDGGWHTPRSCSDATA